MRYINREYGFEGRPPFFKGYAEIKSKGLSSDFFRYPNKPFVGYGLRYDQANGAFLHGEKGTVWGARVSYQKYGKWVEAKDFLQDIGNFFAANKDGSFAYFNHGDITVNFTKHSQNKLVMLVSGMTKVKVRLEFFAVAPKDISIKQENGKLIKAYANERAVIPGTIKNKDFDMEIKDRYEVEHLKKASRKEYFVAKGYFSASEVIEEGSSIVYEYNLDESFSRIMFFLAVGGKEIFEELPTIDELNAGVSATELIYTTEKIVGSGTLGDNVSNAISRSIWHKIYDPFLRQPILVENREKCNEYYSYDTTHLAVGALIHTFTGEYEDAISQLSICISDRILGALTAWTLYCRTRNIKIIEKFLPKILSNFDIDGELITASGISLREIAFKQVDSPLKDITTSTAYSLDMSCYKLLSLDIAYRMATIIGHKSTEEILQAKKSLKKSINLILFNEKLGLYMDRYLNGEFIPVYGATTFLPLVAGAVDSVERLEKVILALKDPKKFGGDYMVPTLVKAHPSYGKKTMDSKGKEFYPYEGYRGMISPVINLLIYWGLKRYGVSEVQSKLARSCTRVYDEILKQYNLVPDFYLPTKKIKSKNSCSQSLSGNIMAFIGMLEMIDVEYFRSDMRASLSFGTLLEGTHRLANVVLLGRKFSINISNNQTSLLCNNQEFFKGSGGKFIVRNFVENPEGAEFIIFSNDEVTLDITLPMLVKSKKKTNYVFNIQKGKYKVIIDKNNEIKPTQIQFNT